ncbi:MAG TPA: 2-dehydropantoate 2-reductase N-terminal domain-containing protein [Actinocrinis sp.]
MRYIIIGAGAIGGAIGARLFQSGHDVVLVARSAHYEALRSHGLTLADPEETQVLRIPAADTPEAVDLRADDVLILAVKGQDTAAALDAWADRPVAGAAEGARAADMLPVVCAQNGVENERVALRRFEHVYGMCVWLPAVHLEPGVVEAQGKPYTGVLHIGRYPTGTGGTDETAARIADDLEKSTFLAPVHRDVMRWKYAKLLSNLGNSLEALCGGRSGSPAVEEVARRVRAEGEAALTAAGIEWTNAEEERASRASFQLRPVGGTARRGGSSWQSLNRGTGTIESDFLNGEVAMLGRLHGVPTPVNARLQLLAKRFARERRPAGSLDPAEILRGL